MKPAPFTLYRPDTVADALRLASQDDEAKFIAGGQSLLALMNFRLARPSVLVDVTRLRELDRMFDEGPSLLFGALTSHRTLETSPLVRAEVPLLSEAARYIGHVAIRNQGTLGGTIAHADAAAELPGALLALDATVFVERDGKPRRELPIGQVFDGLYSTTLEPDELIAWVRVPKPTKDTRSGFAEIAPRHGDFAETGCAVLLQLVGGRVDDMKAAFVGLSDRPTSLDGVKHLRGRTPDRETLAEVGHAIRSDDRLAGTPDYQRHLASVAFARAVEAALNFEPEEELPRG